MQGNLNNLTPAKQRLLDALWHLWSEREDEEGDQAQATL